MAQNIKRSDGKLYGSHTLHESLKQSIICNPKILELESIVAYKEEVPYAKEGKKLGQIDLIVWDGYGQPYLVEVTTSTTNKSRRRIKKQVKRAKKYFVDYPAFSVIKKRGYLEVIKF